MEFTESNGGMATGVEDSTVARLKEQLRQEHEMYLRALADFDNYRKRVESDATSAAQRAKRDLVLSLLELVDSFDRALQHVNDESSAIAEGVKAIYRRLQHVLEREGVTPIQSLGQKFDPRLHEAIDSVHSDEYEPGTIIEELQRGYRWGGELLRPARVRVAS